MREYNIRDGFYNNIKNFRELQKEKGIYYPYIMQLMGAPVIDGVLIEKTDLKYFYASYIEGILQEINNTIRIKSDGTEVKVFPKIIREQFKFSMEWALADLFNDGCDFEDKDWDKIFSFMDKENYAEILVD